MSRSCRWVEADKVLLITQDGKVTPYTVTELETDDRVAKPAFRLHKTNGTFYDVHGDKYGVHCTCADSVYRSRLCKHGAALIAVKLISRDQHESQKES